MLTASATWSAASGRLAGVVATHGRGGAQFRSIGQRVQPRSPSQQNNRALIGTLSQAWRTLTSQQQVAWGLSAAASATVTRRGALFTPTGYGHFVSCNRNLLTIGATRILANPQPPPSLPTLSPFAATPQLDTTTTPPNLTGWLITCNPLNTPIGVLVLRASPALSPGRGHVRESELRIIATQGSWAQAGFVVCAEWFAVYGTLPSNGTITFQAHLVDPISGVAGPSVRARSNQNGVAPSPPPAGTINVWVNSIEIGTVPLQVIEVGGVPVAAP
jgi:hypothetical protein